MFFKFLAPFTVKSVTILDKRILIYPFVSYFNSKIKSCNDFMKQDHVASTVCLNRAGLAGSVGAIFRFATTKGSDRKPVYHRSQPLGPAFGSIQGGTSSYPASPMASGRKTGCELFKIHTIIILTPIGVSVIFSLFFKFLCSGNVRETPDKQGRKRRRAYAVNFVGRPRCR